MHGALCLPGKKPHIKAISGDFLTHALISSKRLIEREPHAVQAV